MMKTIIRTINIQGRVKGWDVDSFAMAPRLDLSA